MPQPRCPDCGAVLERDVAGISSAPITLGWFTCPICLNGLTHVSDMSVSSSTTQDLRKSLTAMDTVFEPKDRNDEVVAS